MPECPAPLSPRFHMVVAGAAGGALACLPASLRAACPDWTVAEAGVFAPVPGAGPRAAILVHLPADPETIIRAAEAFASLDGPDDRLILSIALVRPANEAGADWPGEEDGARLSAFTRHAARAWAPRGIRVNRLCIAHTMMGAAHAAGAAGCVADAAGLIRHMQGWRSMTGQTLQFGSG